jgi:hypothetical protein
VGAGELVFIGDSVWNDTAPTRRCSACQLLFEFYRNAG